jgi:2,3-dihydroxybenzoate-AMP ligase
VPNAQEVERDATSKDEFMVLKRSEQPGFTPWPETFAERYRRSGYWSGETLGDMLRRVAQQYADRTALVGAGRRVTYAELDRRANELCAGLFRLGLRPAERVIVQLPNVPELVEVLFGLFRLGAIPVFALPAHRATELEAFARATDAVAYITSDASSGHDYPSLGRRLRSAVASVQHIVIVGEAEELTGLSSLQGQATKLVGPSASEVAFLQLSGGSTSVPKLIPRTHDDYLYSVRRSAEICELSESSVYLCALPAAHNFPWSSPGVLGVLHCGGTVVFAQRPSPDVTFPLIEREKVTITALVPPLISLWLEAAKTRRGMLSSLLLLQVGGAKLALELARRVEPGFGCKLQQVYGMAEGLVCYTRPEDSEETVLGTQGRPMCPDDELRVVDPAGDDVEIGIVGELWTRGPYTIRGYYRADEINRDAFSVEGYYRTGDLVRLTPTGHVIVEGRVKDQINRGGEKVSAEEIENHLLASPDVRDAIVVALPDRFLGEQACAFVIPARAGLGAAELLAFLRRRQIASYKLPDRIRFVSEFPQTGVGKISRSELREHLKLVSSAELSTQAAAKAQP